MKICMIVPDAQVKGGIATVVNGYRAYQFGEKYQVSFIESYRDGSKWEKLIKALKGYGAFSKELKNNCPDIVHIHSSFGPSFYRKMPFIYMACRKGIPVINHIHGAEFETFYDKASNRKKELIGKVYNTCQMLIALSDEWKDNLKKVVPEEKICVLENYCIIPELTSDKRKNQILFLGEIGKRKGCFDIPHIYERTLSQMEDTPLIMAGDGEVAEVKALFEDKEVIDTVVFPGWVRGEDKDKLLRESSIFLFPSYNEGMPMVVLEAMAYGLAIVTTNVGGIPKLIDDGVSGYICEPGDIQTISDRLVALLSDETKGTEMGKVARKKAIDNYSFSQHMNKLLGLYTKVEAEVNG